MIIFEKKFTQMEIYKTKARLARERKDRITAAAFTALQRKYPNESNTNLMMSLAVSSESPYNSLAGVRMSLIRSKTI